MTPEDKLKAVERLIVAMREFRDQPDAPQFVILAALKEVATDLRARIPGAAEVARRELGRRVAAAVEGDLDMARMLALAHELVSRWAVVENALELVDACRVEQRQPAVAP